MNFTGRLLAMVLVLVLSAPAALRGAGQEWTLERDLEIGEAQKANYALSPVRGLAVDHHGRIFVGQPMDGMVRVYSSDGHFLREIGSRGEGPGEFQSISSFGILGDSLWISDLSQDRVTWFSLDGELLYTRTWKLKLGNGESQRAVPEEFLRGGYAVASPTLTFGRAETPEQFSDSPVYLVSSEMKVLRELFSVSTHKLQLLMAFDRGRVVSSYQPLRDTPMVESLPDGAGLVEVRRPAAEEGDSARFRIVIRSPEGNPIDDWRVSYRPVPVSEERQKEYIANAARRLTRSPSGGPPEERAREIAEEALYLPEYYPPVSKLVVGRDGALWLRRERTEEYDRWEAYDQDGELFGTVRSDSGMRVLAAEEGALWAAQRTRAGIPRVVRLAIRRE